MFMKKKQESSSELRDLLYKYKNKELNIGDAYRLKELLEEEKAKKEREGDINATILAGVILVGVIAFIIYEKRISE